ncbi:MAG TPA: hypothetical protein VKS25_07195, partial [Solirubrobacteraceae bacterium]|nr:hypothetical protein [Solirubrobacteraceae bacterium]
MRRPTCESCGHYGAIEAGDDGVLRGKCGAVLPVVHSILIGIEVVSVTVRPEVLAGEPCCQHYQYDGRSLAQI